MKYLYFTLALTGLLYSTIGTAVTGTAVINVQLQQSIKMVEGCVNIKHRKMKKQEKMKKRCFKKLNKKIAKWDKKIKRFQKRLNKCKNDTCRNKFQSKVANLQGLSYDLKWALIYGEQIIKSREQVTILPGQIEPPVTEVERKKMDEINWELFAITRICYTSIKLKDPRFNKKMYDCIREASLTAQDKICQKNAKCIADFQLEVGKILEKYP